LGKQLFGLIFVNVHVLIKPAALKGD
jgi:hypothetical protein